MEISEEKIKEVFNSLSVVDQQRVFADSFASKSKYYVEGEEFYTCDCPICCGVQFFEKLSPDSEYLDDLDYPAIYDFIQKMYKCKISHIFKNKTYEEIKESIHRVERMQYLIRERSIYRFCHYDGGEEFMKRYDKLCNEFYIAHIAPYRTTELEWLDFIQKILESLLIEKGWFKDLYTTKEIAPGWYFALADATIKGLKEIDVDFEINRGDVINEWKCLRRILPHIVPKEKQSTFSKVARKHIVELYDGYYKLPL